MKSGPAYVAFPLYRTAVPSRNRAKPMPRLCVHPQMRPRKFTAMLYSHTDRNADRQTNRYSSTFEFASNIWMPLRAGQTQRQPTLRFSAVTTDTRKDHAHPSQKIEDVSTSMLPLTADSPFMNTAYHRRYQEPTGPKKSTTGCMSLC